MNGMVRSRCTQYVYESSVAVTSCQNAVLMPWSKACTTNQSVFEAFGLNPAHSLPLGRKLYGQGRWRWRWWWRPWWWLWRRPWRWQWQAKGGGVHSSVGGLEGAYYLAVSTRMKLQRAQLTFFNFVVVVEASTFENACFRRSQCALW